MEYNVCIVSLAYLSGGARLFWGSSLAFKHSIMFYLFLLTQSLSREYLTTLTPLGGYMRRKEQ